MNMLVDYKKVWFSIWQYDDKKGTYVVEKAIPINDILNYEYTARDFNDSDEFIMQLKAKSEYTQYVPNNAVEFSSLKPMIIAKQRGNEIIWFSFIAGRALLRSKEENYVQLSGVSFTGFNEWKLVSSNLNFNQKGEDLPEDFAFYKRTTSFNNHLKYIYNSAYTDPKFMTYGKLANKPAPIRKFKGLNKIHIDYDGVKTSAIRFPQQDVKASIEHLCKVFDYEPVTKQNLDVNSGMVDIDIGKPRIVDKNLVDKITDVTEKLQQQESRTNYVFGYGWGNNAVNVYTDTNAYFTTLEEIKDVSFIGKQNNKYVKTVAQTYLDRAIKDRLTYALQMSSQYLFTELFCGDVITYENNYYKLVTIKESDSIEGQTFEIELKMTDENGITIKDAESSEVDEN